MLAAERPVISRGQGVLLAKLGRASGLRRTHLDPRRDDSERQGSINEQHRLVRSTAATAPHAANRRPKTPT